MGSHNLTRQKETLAVQEINHESGKIGKRNGKHAEAKSQSKKIRVWHTAESEEGCGNYTQLMEQEKPSELCTEANSTFCICTAREDTSEENHEAEEADTEWQFKCGSCQLKWSVEKDETEEDSKKEETKVVKKEKKKKLSKSEKKRKEDRTKMRKKLKVKNEKSGKKQ